MGAVKNRFTWNTNLPGVVIPRYAQSIVRSLPAIILFKIDETTDKILSFQGTQGDQ